MRVIAGRWRGRKLATLRGDRVRPTADRVKEALFSILGPRLGGAVVLDLCCGTGGLGIEALSRGAEHVTFVDADGRSLDQVRCNLELLGVAADSTTIRRGDAVRTLADFAAPRQPWLVLADPPYADETARALGEELLRRATEEHFAGAVIEHAVDRPPLEARETGPRVEIRRYGGCALTVIRPD